MVARTLQDVGYREGAPEQPVVAHTGLFVPWRGVIAAGICALASALALHAMALPGFALWAPTGALALVALVSTLWRARWITVRVLARARRVLVRERGVGGAFERELALSEGDALALRTVRDASWIGQLPAPALHRTSIVRIGADGELALISPLPGAERARAIAERLRELLAIAEPLRVETPSEPSARSNLRSYVLFASLFTLVSIVASGAELAGRVGTGRFDLVCTERCHFEGMDCLPGGRISGRYPPGELVAFVGDPAAPQGRRPVRVTILESHVTTLECRAGAVSPTPVPEP